MKPVKFAGVNAVFTAPDCDDLPAMKQENEQTGAVSVTSVWKPSTEELEILNAGGCICLAVIGGQPPVALWVQEVNTVD